MLKDELKHVEKLPVKNLCKKKTPKHNSYANFQITSEVKRFLKGQMLNQHKVRSCQTYDKELMKRRRDSLKTQLLELRMERRRLGAENDQLELQIKDVQQILSTKPPLEPSTHGESAKYVFYTIIRGYVN